MSGLDRRRQIELSPEATAFSSPIPPVKNLTALVVFYSAQAQHHLGRADRDVKKQGRMALSRRKKYHNHSANKVSAIDWRKVAACRTRSLRSRNIGTPLTPRRVQFSRLTFVVARFSLISRCTRCAHGAF
jgi:hypothetical protein